MTKSTIVIPNYNGMKYIGNCLASLYENSLVEFDVIVVDNASNDGSLAYIREKFPQVKVICNEKNEGFSVAVNQGIKASRTEYVILLNNDTCADRNFVVELEKAMEKDEAVFSAGAKHISMKDMESLDDAGDYYCALGWAFARGKGKKAQKFTKSCPVFASCAGAAIYRKSILDKIGLFDEAHFAYFEDIDIGYRARINGYKNVFVPTAVVYHAGSATSGSRYNEFKTNLASRNSVYLIYKNMPFLQVLLNLPFLLLGFLIKTAFFFLKGYGVTYVKGLWKGVLLSAGEEGKRHKVRFHWKNMGHYVRIQLELWLNIFRIF